LCNGAHTTGSDVNQWIFGPFYFMAGGFFMATLFLAIYFLVSPFIREKGFNGFVLLIFDFHS